MCLEGKAMECTVRWARRKEDSNEYNDDVDDWCVVVAVEKKTGDARLVAVIDEKIWYLCNDFVR